MARINDENSGKVALAIPKGGRNAPDIQIQINGKRITLPRGKTHMVEPHVAEEYYRRVRAEEKYDETVDRLAGIKKA